MKKILFLMFAVLVMQNANAQEKKSKLENIPSNIAANRIAEKRIAEIKKIKSSF